MSLAPFATVQDALRLQQNLERRFRLARPDSPTFETWSPAVDVYESEEGITLTAELPGLAASDIELRVEDDTLFLKGSRKLEHEETAGNYRRRERAYGSFSRSFALPPTVDSGNIEAKSKNGLLTVFLPRREETKPRQIEVKVSE